MKRNLLVSPNFGGKTRRMCDKLPNLKGNFSIKDDLLEMIIFWSLYVVLA